MPKDSVILSEMLPNDGKVCIMFTPGGVADFYITCPDFGVGNCIMDRLSDDDHLYILKLIIAGQACHLPDEGILTIGLYTEYMDEDAWRELIDSDELRDLVESVELGEWNPEAEGHQIVSLYLKPGWADGFLEQIHTLTP